MATQKITIQTFKPMAGKKAGSSLRGFATAVFPSGMIIHNVAIHEKDGKAWASAPSAPMLNSDGIALIDSAGKRRYSPVVEFVDDATRYRWSAAVIAALRAAHPQVLTPPPTELREAAR